MQVSDSLIHSSIYKDLKSSFVQKDVWSVTVNTRCAILDTT